MRWTDLKPHDVLVGHGEYDPHVYVVLKRLAYVGVDSDWKVLNLNTGVVTCIRGDDARMSPEAWEVFRP